MADFWKVESVTAKVNYIKELEKENAELKAQIEKMKCCGNCKFFDGCAGDYLKRGFKGYINDLKQPCNKWELAE